MRILVLTDQLTPSGSISALLGLMAGLRRRNHTVQVVCFGGRRIGQFEAHGVVVRAIRPFLFTLPWLGNFRPVVEITRSFRPDIIQVETTALLAAGVRLGRLLGVPVITVVHKYLHEGERIRPALNARTWFVTVSQALREYLVNTLKVPKERITVVADGIDPALYQPAAAIGAREIPAVGMAGTYHPERGHAAFLGAARLMLEAKRDLMFFIAGYGPGEERVKRQARALGIYPRVTFVSDFFDVREVLGLFDICVVPSLREGLGYLALEAMAMGKPVVASSVGGLVDVVADGETGLLVQPDNPEKLAGKVMQLLDHPDQAARMGARGREQVAAAFGVDAMVDGMLAVYLSQVRHDGRTA
ncbi:MAG: glycosyltransferase family 4 protein [Planctomycetota bacterium]